MRPVGVLIDGEITWHAPAARPGCYDTLCAIDANDPKIGHGGTVQAKRGQKITCESCYMFWRDVVEMKLTKRHFAGRG